MEKFSRQPLMLRLDFHVISIFCLQRALYKIHTWKLFVYGNIFAFVKVTSQLADGPTRRRQLADVQNRVEMSASWSSFQYNLLEVKHTEN